MNIFGVRIDELDKKQTQDLLVNYLQSSTQHSIFTPNPEMLVAAYRDGYFRDILNTSDINLCDGRGVEYVGGGKLTRYPGIDCMLDLCALAETHHKRVYILGTGKRDVLEKTVTTLTQKFPNLHISGTHPGPTITFKKNEGYKYLQISSDEHDVILHDIIMAAPDILFVAFGQKKQELWIHEYLHTLPSVRVAIGVGGACEMISGHITRAPFIFRRLGLEWLWRLFQEPHRIRRIFTAVCVFPSLVLFDSIKNRLISP